MCKHRGMRIFAPEFALETGDELDKNDWWIDSGASQHMTPDKEEMTEYERFESSLQIKLADNSVLHAYGKGNVHLSIYDGTEKIGIVLKDVLFVPKIKNKLLSLPTITDKGVDVQFKGQFCKIMLGDKMYNIGHKHGKLYKLNCLPQATCCFGSAKDKDDSWLLWHLRYGHLGYDNIKLLCQKSMVRGLDLNVKDKFDRSCEGCTMGKQNRLPFPKASQHQSSQPLELVYSDVCGPMSVDSVGGSKFFVTFIDSYSRFTTVYMMKVKSEVFGKFNEFLQMSENLTEKRLKTLRSDNGGEYISAELKQFCKGRGIRTELTIPYTPQQNGVAERMNRTLMEAVRCMLYHSNLPLRFWAEAVSTAVYLRNRSPTSSLKEITPYERWYNKKPDVNHLKVFGCDAYVHVSDKKRRKLDKKSNRCIFIGYPSNSKGYKLYNAETGGMLRSRDVVFMENRFRGKISMEKSNMENCLAKVYILMAISTLLIMKKTYIRWRMQRRSLSN